MTHIMSNHLCEDSDPCDRCIVLQTKTVKSTVVRYSGTVHTACLNKPCEYLNWVLLYIIYDVNDATKQITRKPQLLTEMLAIRVSSVYHPCAILVPWGEKQKPPLPCQSLHLHARLAQFSACSQKRIWGLQYWAELRVASFTPLSTIVPKKSHKLSA